MKRTTIQTTIFVERDDKDIEVTVSGDLRQDRDFQGYPGQGDSIRNLEAEFNGEPFALTGNEEDAAMERLLELA